MLTLFYSNKSFILKPYKGNIVFISLQSLKSIMGIIYFVMCSKNI